MFIGFVSTRNFDFLGTGDSIDSVNKALLESWGAHCLEYSCASTTLMEELINNEDVNYQELELGKGIRI